jgi:hypothetical protein
MDRKQAYDYFQKALTAQLIRVAKELDSCQVGSPRYDEVTVEHVRIQTALANLDDIANLI